MFFSGSQCSGKQITSASFSAALLPSLKASKIVSLTESRLGLNCTAAALIVLGTRRKPRILLPFQLLGSDINQLLCDFSLVGQRDVYDLLGPVHYKEFVRVCLKAYPMPVHIIRRNKVSILLADRSECLVDQFLVSNTVFRLESNQKGLRTCPSRLCNDLWRRL